MPLCGLLDHVGILARSVQDVAHAYEIVADIRSSDAHPNQPSRSPASWQLGIPADLDALSLEEVVRDAFTSSLERLRSAGFALSPLDVSGYSFGSARRAGLLLCEAELLGTLAVPLAQRREELPSDLMAMLEYAQGVGAVRVGQALAAVIEAGHWVHRALVRFDALLMPTAGQTAFAMNGPVPPGQADFTAMANMAGAPALSVPMPMPSGELPAGLHLLGCRGEDRSLLDLAMQVESVLR